MKSVRTGLHFFAIDQFKIFLSHVGLNDVIVGDYIYIKENWYAQKCICYAYSEKSNETVAILTHITLKYGNLHNAFSKYMSAQETTTKHQPFNWTP